MIVKKKEKNLLEKTHYNSWTVSNLFVNCALNSVIKKNSTSIYFSNCFYTAFRMASYCRRWEHPQPMRPTLVPPLYGSRYKRASEIWRAVQRDVTPIPKPYHPFWNRIIWHAPVAHLCTEHIQGQIPKGVVSQPSLSVSICRTYAAHRYVNTGIRQCCSVNSRRPCRPRTWTHACESTLTNAICSCPAFVCLYVCVWLNVLCVTAKAPHISTRVV